MCKCSLSQHDQEIFLVCIVWTLDVVFTTCRKDIFNTTRPLLVSQMRMDRLFFWSTRAHTHTHTPWSAKQMWEQLHCTVLTCSTDPAIKLQATWLTTYLNSLKLLECQPRSRQLYSVVLVDNCKTSWLQHFKVSAKTTVWGSKDFCCFLECLLLRVSLCLSSVQKSVESHEMKNGKKYRMWLLQIKDSSMVDSLNTSWFRLLSSTNIPIKAPYNRARLTDCFSWFWKQM